MTSVSHLDGLIDLVVEAVLREMVSGRDAQTQNGREEKVVGDGEQTSGTNYPRLGKPHPSGHAAQTGAWTEFEDRP